MDEDNKAPVEGESVDTSTDNTPALPELEDEGGEVTAGDIEKILGKGKVDASAIEKPADTEDEEETPQEPETPADEVVEPSKEEPVKPTEKPKETTTDSETPEFTIEVEDAEGKSHKIERIEDLPEDFEPKNNRQIMEILRDLSIKENERNAYEADQEKAKADAEQQERVAEVQSGWDKEIKALQGEKRIPVTTDPNKNERVEQIYKFMGEENNRREKAGKPPLMTIEDVLDKLEIQEAKDAKAKAASEAKETARKNGALISGGGAPAGGGTPVYKGGAKNATQALKMMGVL